MSIADGRHPGWDKLLDWLQSHGMDVSQRSLLVEPRTQAGAGYGLFALNKIPPSTPVLTIPPSALMNWVTLSPLYPTAKPKLSASQLISLHIFLHRPLPTSLDPHFGPYISVLPKDFETHPLQWLWNVRRQQPEASATKSRLLEALPISVTISLHDTARKFHADWEIVQRYLINHVDLVKKSQLAEHFPSTGCELVPDLEAGYLWAWLNVNTRCVYHRIKDSASDPDNITLCPVLDFANHTSQSPTMTPQEISSTFKRRRPLTLVSSSDASTMPGQEMYLKYGAHANRTLFVEYGFVNGTSTEAILDGSIYGEVDLDSTVKQLFKDRGPLGKWMEECLREQSYWGEWTMHSSPTPAHPSYRLITALRLYHIVPMPVRDIPDDIEAGLTAWKDTALGTRESVSAENETLWRESLLNICEGVKKKATHAIGRLKSDSVDVNEEDASVLQVKQFIEMLWQEELAVSLAVKESLRGGVQF